MNVHIYCIGFFVFDYIYKIIKKYAFCILDYSYGIRLGQRVDGKVLVTFNARNEHDRCKFIEDLRESISEMDEMETLRIEMELERQKSNRGTRSSSENRDSGVADVEVCPCPGSCLDRSEIVDSEMQMKRSALSNSLLDIHEQCKYFCSSIKASSEKTSLK